MANLPDYYKMLGVSRNATVKEIKDQYQKLINKFHPHLNPKSKRKRANRISQDLNNAYEVLSSDNQRKKYDYHKFWNSRVDHKWSLSVPTNEEKGRAEQRANSWKQTNPSKVEKEDYTEIHDYKPSKKIPERKQARNENKHKISEQYEDEEVKKDIRDILLGKLFSGSMYRVFKLKLNSKERIFTILYFITGLWFLFNLWLSPDSHRLIVLLMGVLAFEWFMAVAIIIIYGVFLHNNPSNIAMEILGMIFALSSVATLTLSFFIKRKQYKQHFAMIQRQIFLALVIILSIYALASHL